MVVNSLPFLLFFIVVFAVYYLPAVRKSKQSQNIWLLVTSYFFYGYADWKMIPLLLGSTAVFYLLGKCIKKKIDEEKWDEASHITTLCVCLGVGVLLYFKYLNFFAEEIAGLLTSMGFSATWTTLNIVVPIGVSFFTFKLIGYVIEIYQEGIEPSEDFVEFATYIAFFPTILSGPIDRPDKFLPQMRKPHSFDYALAVDGSRQILWGMFIKMCIADNIARGTDLAWTNHADMDGMSLLALMFLYFIQLYADFSGYSHMAIGVGKLLGFRIERNFNHPLLARNAAEYWRRWHMSLTNWITDYIYMPLNFTFRRWGKAGAVTAIMINLTVIGLWHGANWTYIVFGLYYGVLFIPLVLMGTMNNTSELKAGKWGLPKANDFVRMCIMFVIASIGAMIFRAPDMGTAWAYFSGIFTHPFIENPMLRVSHLGFVVPAVIMMIALEWAQRDKEHELQLSGSGALKYGAVRWGIYLALMLMIVIFRGSQATFIYFQF